MTVAKLIEMLKTAPLTAEVSAFDADSEAHMPVTGMVYGHNEVVLQTDDIS